VVTQTHPPHFDHADDGSIFLRDVGTPVQHYTVSQNPNSAQLTVSVSVAACPQYIEELPQPENSFFHVAGDGEKAAELGDFPHMVSGQAPRSYRTTFRSRSQANVQFI